MLSRVPWRTVLIQSKAQSTKMYWSPATLRRRPQHTVMTVAVDCSFPARSYAHTVWDRTTRFGRVTELGSGSSTQLCGSRGIVSRSPFACSQHLNQHIVSITDLGRGSHTYWSNRITSDDLRTSVTFKDRFSNAEMQFGLRRLMTLLRSESMCHACFLFGYHITSFSIRFLVQATTGQY